MKHSIAKFSLGLAIAFQKIGYSVGIIDCDIYGSSIPVMLNIQDQRHEVHVPTCHIIPIKAQGIQLMSCRLLTEEKNVPPMLRIPIFFLS